MDRLSTVSSPIWTSSVVSVLLGAVTVVFGLQLMRTLFVEIAVYLTQVRDVDSMLVGAMGLGLSAAGTVLFLWSLPLLLRSIGPAEGHGSAPHAAIALLLVSPPIPPSRASSAPSRSRG